MSSWLGKLHDKTKWLDPIGHYSLDAAHKTSTQTVSETSKLLGDGADSLGINSHLPRYWEGKANRDHDSFGTWGENTAGSAALIYGGLMGLGGSGGGTTGASSLGTGNGAFLGEGVASGVPAWDGAAGGMGLGFNPSGFTSPGGNLDIPGGSTGKMPGNIQGFGGMNNMGSMFGQGGGQQQGGSRRQNLPLIENEKTDQQKLAELLTALQNQEA